MEREMIRPDAVVSRWRADFDFKTFLSAGASLAATTVFALYNGLLGVLHRSLWNGSICIYYLVLSSIRLAIIGTQHHAHKRPGTRSDRLVRRTFNLTSLALVALNVTLFPPVSLMVELRKPISVGLIPAIGMAAYTVFRVTLACVNYRRRTQSTNLLTRELRSINLMDALLAIITLQNLLVSVKDSAAEGRILALMAISSATLLAAMIAISLRNRILGMRELRSSQEAS